LTVVIILPEYLELAEAFNRLTLEVLSQRHSTLWISVLLMYV